MGTYIFEISVGVGGRGMCLEPPYQIVPSALRKSTNFAPILFLHSIMPHQCYIPSAVPDIRNRKINSCSFAIFRYSMVEGHRRIIWPQCRSFFFFCWGGGGSEKYSLGTYMKFRQNNLKILTE